MENDELFNQALQELDGEDVAAPSEDIPQGRQ